MLAAVPSEGLSGRFPSSARPPVGLDIAREAVGDHFCPFYWMSLARASVETFKGAIRKHAKRRQMTLEIPLIPSLI